MTDRAYQQPARAAPPSPVASPRLCPCGIVRLTGFGRREQFRENGGMRKPPNPHYRHRFSAELISHAVWLYHVFSLSFRDVELLLAERGVKVSYESVRQWCLKFGASFANNLRRRKSV